MRKNSSPSLSRHDYQPYPYQLCKVALFFQLDAQCTHVRSELTFQRLSEQPEPLVLDGTDIQLVAIALDGQELQPAEYSLTEHTLSLTPKQYRFTLTIDSSCTPADNTALMGLYQSGRHLFTQCEAEGFRRITWFPDRPDVMATYTVTLQANKHDYPILLSNGHLVSQRNLEDGQHEVTWHDPYPKPCYLFAIVAGDFAVREHKIRTRSERLVTLQIYSDRTAHPRTAWAMACLEHALRWDEARFNLELDLDRFMVVAARDFNMGAMENKGLNIFNASYVLACPDTATDQMYRTIEAVIGHEYFHNWTGNRVTCRDWFQLSLKEGLTVFREQEFAADMLAAGLDGAAATSARAVKRIDDVNILRNQQFPEDAGPMAHPVRPESYIEISNFYTATIYEKGAELIRMLHTLLGEDSFQQGMAEYLRRHDGQAVTCDDFLDAMQSVCQTQHPPRDLHRFSQWYQQAGTPRVHIEAQYDAGGQTLQLTMRQTNPPVGLETQQADQAVKPPLLIPIAIGMLRSNGEIIAFEGAQGPAQTRMFELTEREQSWTVPHLSEPPVLSVLRGFSAPVHIQVDQDENELELLALHDPDPFARWEAIQRLSAQTLWERADHKTSDAATRLTQALARICVAIMQDHELAPDYQARALTLIAGSQLMYQRRPLDPQRSHQARYLLEKDLGQQLAAQWLDIYQRHEDVAHQPYRPHAVDAGKRALRAVALNYLVAADHHQALELAIQQYKNAHNLTDRLSAITALTQHADQQASQELLRRFYQDATDESVVDQWFGLQARARWADTNTARELMNHQAFSLRNPNRARAVIYQFCLHNPLASHRPEGYDFWAEQILRLDALNPELGARLARGLENWSDTIEPHRSQIQHILQGLSQSTDLSANLKEVINRALDNKGVLS